MIIQKVAPELARLRRALRIQWKEYYPWIDHSLPTIAALEKEAIAEGEEDVLPLIRAQYIHEMWWTYP